MGAVGWEMGDGGDMGGGSSTGFYIRGDGSSWVRAEIQWSWSSHLVSIFDPDFERKSFGLGKVFLFCSSFLILLIIRDSGSRILRGATITISMTLPNWLRSSFLPLFLTLKGDEHTSYLSQISQMRYVEKNLSCGEISDLYAREMWRNLKFLHMCSNFKLLQMTDVEKFEVSPQLACVWCGECL